MHITWRSEFENKDYRLFSFSGVEQVRRPINPHRRTQPSKTYIKMEATLLELARTCPDVTISVKASDLIEAGRTIKEELLQELNALQPEDRVPENEQLLSREETMEKFKISSATIWRWKKCGYLVPVKVGSMDRYRLSDVNAILIKKGGVL